MPILIICVSIAALLLGFYLVGRKRKQARNNPAKLKEYGGLLEDHVSFYKRLPAPMQERFLMRVVDFLSAVRIEGVGLKPEPLDRVLVAASAIIPIFAFDGWRYPNITNIILYPDTFNKDFQYEGAGRNTFGMVGTGYMNGQMLLSRKALHDGFSADDGRNTGIHEFAHLLDKADGSTDGLPENFLGRHHIAPWLDLMHREMQRIASGKSEIDSYALINEAEFFAVVSEYFFEKPEQLREKHPDLYGLLQEMFGAAK